MKLVMTMAERLSKWTREELSNLIVLIQASWNVNHQYDGTHGNIQQFGRSESIGVPVNISVRSDSFVAATGTFTPGTITDYSYDIEGQMMELSFYCNGVTSAATQTLSVKLPEGYVAARSERALTGWLYDIVGATGYAGLAIVAAGASYVTLYLSTLGNIPATASLEVCFKLRFEVTE